MFKNETALKLNIQRFADTAENDSEELETNSAVNTEIAGGDEELDFVDGSPSTTTTTTDDNDKKISTKAFSERLKREKLKLQKDAEDKKQADLDNIAISKGFKNWKDFEQVNRKEKLEKIGIEDEETFTSLIDDAVTNNPIVLEAQRVIDAQREREQKAVLDAAIHEISAIDPDIKSLNDLLALDNYNEFYDLVERGYALPDAYKIISFDKLSNKKAASAAQTVINNVNSKGHITTTKGTQTKEITVPDEILAGYRKNNPDMSEDEIRKHYSKFIGGGQ